MKHMGHMEQVFESILYFRYFKVASVYVNAHCWRSLSELHLKRLFS